VFNQNEVFVTQHDIGYFTLVEVKPLEDPTFEFKLNVHHIYLSAYSEDELKTILLKYNYRWRKKHLLDLEMHIRVNRQHWDSIMVQCVAKESSFEDEGAYCRNREEAMDALELYGFVSTKEVV
jgi:hypothetical protein